MSCRSRFIPWDDHTRWRIYFLLYGESIIILHMDDHRYLLQQLKRKLFLSFSTPPSLTHPVNVDFLFSLCPLPSRFSPPLPLPT
jgi:hypothetical protein